MRRVHRDQGAPDALAAQYGLAGSALAVGMAECHRGTGGCPVLTDEAWPTAGAPLPLPLP
ncbi:hypothetical protein [Streptomyces sp. NBC_00829]|uniref:hypothetical protein n=1 Tax=Streptomyces sp. NBC_00829 TaxID=2903679 RepID=UPI003864722C|nr:hypothetical protein OG293_07640 [Streptomyces sp. NBC_00829]